MSVRPLDRTVTQNNEDGQLHERGVPRGRAHGDLRGPRGRHQLHGDLGGQDAAGEVAALTVPVFGGGIQLTMRSFGFL